MRGKKLPSKKTPPKSTTKRASKSISKGGKVKSVRVKRKPNAAFMKPMTPSRTLAAVVGGNPMPRTEVTSKLWAYIKKNSLQDPVNKRLVNADDKLREVFGGKKQVSMFEMTRLINRQLSDDDGTNNTGPKITAKKT